MQPPRLLSASAYGPHTIVFEEPVFSLGCGRFHTNGATVLRFYVATYVMPPLRPLLPIPSRSRGPSLEVCQKTLFFAEGKVNATSE